MLHSFVPYLFIPFSSYSPPFPHSPRVISPAESGLRIFASVNQQNAGAQHHVRSGRAESVECFPCINSSAYIA